MDKIKVKNKGNPVYVGKARCDRGTTTSVKKQDYINFCKTPSGKFLNGNSIFIVDGNIKKKQKDERDAIRAQVEAEVRQSLSPTMEKEIKKRLKALYVDKIENLMKKNDDLELKIEELKKVSAGSNTAEDDDADKKEFVFDPEAHTIEHRGGGKYFVMDAEDKKLYGPLTDEEKASFEEMQKEA